jgi:hypothetical protein
MKLGSAAGFQSDFEERHSDGVKRNLQLLSTTSVCCSSVLPKLLPRATNGAPTDLASDSASLVSVLN